MSDMLTKVDGVYKLRVFESFQTDFSLPRHSQKGELSDDGSILSKSGGITISNVVFGDNGIVVRTTARRTLWARFRAWLSWLVPYQVSRSEWTVEEFFHRVKRDGSTLDPDPIIQARAEAYVKALERATQTGQRALYERLVDALEETRLHSQLLRLGDNQYITEDQLVQFAQKCRKGLRLDWVANYTRHIPEEVLEKKRIYDAAKLFDNYVVLQYDPTRKAWAETKAEQERRKDPILFGVIKESRSLYYIGDWVDEFCNLTLDQVVRLVGSGLIEAEPK